MRRQTDRQTMLSCRYHGWSLEMHQIPCVGVRGLEMLPRGPSQPQDCEVCCASMHFDSNGFCSVAAFRHLRPGRTWKPLVPTMQRRTALVLQMSVFRLRHAQPRLRLQRRRLRGTPVLGLVGRRLAYARLPSRLPECIRGTQEDDSVCCRCRPGFALMRGLSIEVA